MKKHKVYMICLGLEEINKTYAKNKNLDNVVKNMKNIGIYAYLSYIVNPLNIIGREEGREHYKALFNRINELSPEIICGNFLMPFRGTKIWDKYYAFVDRSDYKKYDSKTPLMIRNKIVAEKMQFFMFWYQWQYYTSEHYNKNIREFNVGDTLSLKFNELYNEFKPRYEKIWNIRP
jgi:hypothetical protein